MRTGRATDGARPSLIVSADDFGLSVEVNEAVEDAHRRGFLSTASLMVAGPAAADAVRRARALPGLGVGLHLVVVEGDAVLPDSSPGGVFSGDQLALALQYFFQPAARRRLGREIAAQYRAFAATGLRLDHANAHKHMHLHPTVGRLLIEIGRAHGLRAIRVPAEPPSLLSACGDVPSTSARALYTWASLLRWQARREGLLTNDWTLGLAWTGHVTAERVRRAIPHFPPGLGELYLHPATAKTARLETLMPDYEHERELALLTDLSLWKELSERATLRGWSAAGAHTPLSGHPD